jgi:TrmH family RNA methyltransferase
MLRTQERAVRPTAAVSAAITSRRHPLVVACRGARAGGDDQPLLLDGWHLLSEAAASPIVVDAVLVGADPPGRQEREVLTRLADGGAQVARVTDDVLQAASPVRTPSGVVALARRPATSIALVAAASPALIVAALDVQDPGNVGALVRTGEAAGATGLLALGSGADPLGWKALRAAMGSAFRLPTARHGDAGAALADLRARGVRLVALTPAGGEPPEAIDFVPPTCLVLGGEGHGVAPAIAALADARLRLPMRPPVESLNVAVAGALALYAAAAQRERAR